MSTNKLWGVFIPSPSNKTPQEESGIVLADGISAAQIYHPDVDGAGEDVTLTILNTTATVPTISNALVYCPAICINTDPTTSTFYVATGVPGSLCTGYTDIT